MSAGGVDRPNLPRRARWMLAGVVAFVLTIAGVLATFGIRIEDEIDSLRATSRDNVQWSLAQYEVEYLSLLQALSNAKGPTADELEEVRRRFNVFYSRAKLIAESTVFDFLDGDPAVATDLAEVIAMLDEAVPAIDGDDAELARNLGPIADEIGRLKQDIRDVSLAGVRVFAAASDARREDLKGLLRQTAFLALSLFAILIVASVILVLQNRISLRRAEALRLSARRFEQTINGSLNAIIVADSNGRVLGFNPGAERTFGYAREDAIGRNIVDLVVPPRHRAAHLHGMDHHRRTGEGTIVDRGRVEIDAMRAGGEEFPVELSLARTDGPEGELYIAYVRDITQRKAIERELVEARDKALAGAKARSEFLAVMSHEMRTPLNGVLAILDLLADTDLSPKQREFVETAITSGEILQRHIDDVLDMTRIEAGRLKLAEEAFDPVALASEVARINRPAAEARHNTIEVVADKTVPAMLGDRHRLGQVLLNLVGNAVKFTQGGRIAIRVSVREAEGASIVFEVSDTGIGIAPENQERIFEDFVTLDPSYRREASGYGLGLAICRRIVTAMNATIHVESMVGHGSTFRVELPLRRAAAAPEEVPNASEERAVAVPFPRREASLPRPDVAPRGGDGVLNVLLVEDNETNRFAAREMLFREGCRVVEAKDGLIGLHLAERECFDLILMDVSMPRLDGIGATRAIRQGTGLSRQTPIVGLTAHALPEDRERLREAGMADCLVKPLRRAALHAVIAGIARRGEAATVGPDEPDEDPQDAIIDAATLAELIDVLPRDAFVGHVRKVIAEFVHLPRSLRECEANGNLRMLRERAHKANGAAALFGATRLRDILSTLEDACAEGEDEMVTPLLDELDLAVPETCGALARHVRRSDLEGIGPA